MSVDSSFRDQLIEVVRQETEFAVAIDAEFTEPEYVVDHILSFVGTSDHRIVPLDLLRRVSDCLDVQWLSDEHKELAQTFRDAAGLP